MAEAVKSFVYAVVTDNWYPSISIIVFEDQKMAEMHANHVNRGPASETVVLSKNARVVKAEFVSANKK